MSTIGEILKRHGLVKKRRNRGGIFPARHHELTEAQRPNHVWTVDHKGWFLLGNKSRCIPLTVTDLHSHFVIALEASEDSTQATTRRGFLKAFRAWGLPETIRVDNGSPFASMGPGRLSKLSVWWIGQGIRVEFTRPGKPQDNGSHERMHRTLKADCCKPPSCHHAAQQQRFDRWRKQFNEVRPHEAIRMRVPAEMYQPSNNRLDESIKNRLYYPGEETLQVTQSGHIYLEGRNLHVGEALAGSEVALDRGKNGVIEVRYANVRLGEYKSGQKENRIRFPGHYTGKKR